MLVSCCGLCVWCRLRIDAIVRYILLSLTLSNGVWRFVYYKFITEKHLGDLPIKMALFGHVLFKSKSTRYERTLKRNRRARGEANLEEGQKYDYLDEIYADDDDSDDDDGGNDSDIDKYYDVDASIPLITKVTTALALFKNEMHRMALQLRQTKFNLEVTQDELGSADVDLQQTTATLQKTSAALATTNATFEQTKQGLTAITNAVRALQAVPQDKRDVGMHVEALEVGERDIWRDIDDNMPLPCGSSPAAGVVLENSIHEAEKNQELDALVPRNSLQDEDAALVKQALNTLTQYRKTQQWMLATAQDIVSAQEKTRDGANHTRDAFKVTASTVHRILTDAQLTSAGVLKTKAEVLATRTIVDALH